MTSETRKKLMWREHEQAWAPTITAPDYDRHVIRVSPTRCRLVWCQTRKGNHTETRIDCTWAESHNSNKWKQKGNANENQ
jgi:hypothetical protein